MNWSAEKQNGALRRLLKESGLNERFTDDLDTKSNEIEISSQEYELFANEFRAQEHFTATIRHKTMISRVYSKLSNVCIPKNLTTEIIDQHDNSKLSNFLEVVGYTIKNIWKLKSDISTEASNHHHSRNRHHPEYFLKHSNSPYNMDFVGMLESIVDIVAIQWEHQVRNETTPSDALWVDLGEDYLQKYTKSDKIRAKNIMKSCIKYK